MKKLFLYIITLLIISCTSSKSENPLIIERAGVYEINVQGHESEYPKEELYLFKNDCALWKYSNMENPGKWTTSANAISINITSSTNGSPINETFYYSNGAYCSGNRCLKFLRDVD